MLHNADKQFAAGNSASIICVMKFNRDIDEKSALRSVWVIFEYEMRLLWLDEVHAMQFNNLSV